MIRTLSPGLSTRRLGQFDQSATLAASDFVDDAIGDTRWPPAIHDQCGDARTVAGGTPLQDDQDEGVAGEKQRPDLDATAAETPVFTQPGR